MCLVSRGYKRFFKRTLLETSDYLKDDSLLIRCCVGVVKSNTEAPKTYSITVPPTDIGKQFGRLLEGGIGSDVTFQVDGEEFVAHKLVLAARSPVFRAQLFGPLKDQNTKCIKIEDMEAPVFKVLSLPLFKPCHTFLFIHSFFACNALLELLMNWVSKLHHLILMIISGLQHKYIYSIPLFP